MSIKDLGDIDEIKSNIIENFNSVGSIILGEVNETANVKIILEKRNKSVTGILSFPTTELKMELKDSDEEYIEFVPTNNIPTAYIPKNISSNLQLATILRGGTLTITTSDNPPVTSYVSCLLLYDYIKARFVVGLNNRNIDDVNFKENLGYKILGPMTFTYLVD